MRHRVFIGLSEVAGYYGSLAEGFRELGVPTTFIDESDHPFRYGASAWYAQLARLPDRLFAATAARPGSPRRLTRLAIGGAMAAKAAYRLGLFVWAVSRHDVFIFGAGQTFLRRRDLPILKRLGKTVVVVFTGSDHRPPYLNGRFVRNPSEAGFGPALAEGRRLQAAVRDAERHADQIVALGASAHYHIRPVVHFLAMGIPVALGEPPADEGRRWFHGHGVRVLHCPSDPVNKGSDRVRTAIAELRGRGLAIDYVEVAGRPHGEVLSAIRDADLIVDEIYSDTPMAVLATEAAWFGKPVVVCGYYARQMPDDLGPIAVPPTAFAEPAELTSTIERLVRDHVARQQLGARAKEFVSSRWRPAQVAQRYLDLIDGHGRPEWMYDPANLTYVFGWGMPEELVRTRIEQLISLHGRQALGLAHAPALEQRMAEFGV